MWVIAVAAVTIAVAIVIAIATRRRVTSPATDDRSAAPQPVDEETSGLVVELAEHAVPIAKDTVIASRYRVIGKLGADDLGPAFEVARLADGQRFAMRTVRRRGADRMARFAKESAAASEIDHPHLVPVVDQGITGNELYLVMPLVVGGSLEQVRSRFGNPAWALPLLAQVASALAALHEHGLVHRGLQASNVLLAGNTARVTDVALSLIARKGAALDDGDPRADIFAFGLLAREMLGKSEIPAWVARCLDVDPDERPTAAELDATLAEWGERSDAVAKLSAQPIELADQRMIGDRYVVIGRLGAGASGTVHEVERISDGRRLAMKLLRPGIDPKRLARFAREAQAVAELGHPNLLPILEAGFVDGAVFLVMPLVDGGSLLAHKARFGDRAWAMWMLSQIATGLAVLHARRLTHRDLRLANVLVSAGQAKLADIGVAALTNGDQSSKAADVLAFGRISQELLGGELPETFARCLDDDPAGRPSADELVEACTPA